MQIHGPEATTLLPGRFPVQDTFCFACGPEVPCFTRCCRNPDLELYPYDIVRLCQSLGVTSDQFLKTYTHHAQRSNPYFPSVLLTMSPQDTRPCPFLGEQGCGVYRDRPDACRMFPLERGISVIPFSSEPVREEYWLQRVPHCLGHRVGAERTVAEWIEEQGLLSYNRMGELWAEMSLLFRRNPWGPEGSESRLFRMAYMACYNVDAFRSFVFGSSFLNRYRLAGEWRSKIEESNEKLLEFGFDWLKYFLFNTKPLYFTPA